MPRRNILLAALVAALLSALSPGQARADAEGYACVVDGDTLAIGGRRLQTECVGGIVVMLFGVEAPELDQICVDDQGRQWQCGLAAGSALLRFTGKNIVTCKGNSRDAQGRLLAICSTPEVDDIGREMVVSGMAFANSAQSKKYLPAQGTAKNAARGIWRGGDSGVVSPGTWRKNRPQ